MELNAILHFQMSAWIITHTDYHPKVIRRQPQRAFAILPTLLRFVVPILLVGNATASVRAQATEVHVSVLSLTPPVVRVEGKRSAATRIWSFRNAYAGLLGLGERISNLKLTDSAGVDVEVRKLASGEYESARSAIGWSCEIKLSPPMLAADAAYVSWLASDRGFLMLGDLLPRETDENETPENISLVRLSLPATWIAYSNEQKKSDGQFAVRVTDDAVFFVGKDLRVSNERVGQVNYSLVTEGTWAFTDHDVTRIIERILKEYATRVGVNPATRATILLSHFPTSVGAERWSAETRGNTVTLLSGVSPSKVAGLAQLSTPLTHELFHLWVPNGIRLAGNYDWFYEGFTLYEALCVAQRLEFLTFQDYLNAIARAYDAYSSSNEGRRLSLIEASIRRWTGPTALVYQKGMLVAFLYDLTLRQLTHGKRSLDDVYRALFRDANSKSKKREGNEVVLAILRDQEKLQSFVQKYIEKADEVDLQTMITPFGLTVDRTGGRTHIAVARELSSQQRDLLRAFGYNEETRRSGRRTS